MGKMLIAGFVILTIIYWLWQERPDPAKKDAEQVHHIISRAAMYTESADKKYNEGEDVFNAIKMGKPIYQAHDEMKEPVEIVQGELGSLVNLKNDEVPKITNPEIRKNLDAGLTALMDIYATKYQMLRDQRDVLEDLSAVNLMAILAKYKEPMDRATSDEVEAAAQLISAKKKAGLPADLSEFK